MTQAVGMNAGARAALFAEPMETGKPEDCIWYHTMTLPGVGEIGGQWDLRGDYKAYTGGVDMAGKSVLDIGTASGFLSFSAEQAGASEVVSFDMDTGDRQTLQPFSNSLYFTNHAAWVEEQTAVIERWKRGYWTAHRALGSKAKAVYGDVYRLPPALGQFDIVLVCSVLEHLSDPIAALASISRHAAERMVLSVWIPEKTEAPQAWFLSTADRPETAAVHWAYSLPVYREVLTMLGFEIESVTDQSFKHVSGPSPRTTIVARRLKAS